MARDTATRHIETLGRLPLTQLALVKALVEAMHDLVTSRWNGGGIFLDNGSPGAGYGEFEGFMIMAARWHAECAPFFGDTITAAEIARGGVGLTLAIQNAGFELTDVYQKVFRPYGAKWFLDVTVQDEQGPLAGFMLMRGPDDRRFDVADCERIRPVLPSMARAFRASRIREATASVMRVAPVATASGYALVTRDGQMRAMTKAAQLLLQWTAVDAYDLPNYTTAARQFIGDVIADVCAQTRDAAGNRPDELPARRVNNSLGEFCLSLTSLDAVPLPAGIPTEYEVLPHEGPSDPLFSLRIEYREPLVLHLARAMRRAGLAPGQVQIGVMVAIGKSQSEIAEEIGVKRSSVDDAVRKIYARIGVRSAIELAWHFAGRPTG